MIANSNKRNHGCFFTIVFLHISLLQDFGLVCDSLIGKSALGATYMLGMLVGSFVMGLFSDKYGRLKALMVAVFLVAVSGFIGAFVNDPISKDNSPTFCKDISANCTYDFIQASASSASSPASAASAASWSPSCWQWSSWVPSTPC